ncbi:hypothetical protein HMPREF3192_00986 [Atopobium deltae]|uniref:Uncharacterized protein n=1 Tax=Atopobium deltae TaxID=1393034 RepID=A0A133XS55_9ACTN|nr:hypothetical protein HMPREF3192_00986 [Atopobium deltae]
MHTCFFLRFSVTIVSLFYSVLGAPLLLLLVISIAASSCSIALNCSVYERADN